MNVLKLNPNRVIQDFPYLDIQQRNQEFIKKDKLNIGLVLETDRNSNSHDDETIDEKYIEDLFIEDYNVIALDKYIDDQNLLDFCSYKYDYSNLNELAETISRLDLVITVDHAVAHLSGALDIETFLMIPCVPNWRWDITHRHSTPWYKSVKMFRQDIPGDWISVINRVKEELKDKSNVRILN
tara:strand:- start:1121 stop:1669 length:549 start_codon:yes stop_codon:yes gene_type:complete